MSCPEKYHPNDRRNHIADQQMRPNFQSRPIFPDPDANSSAPRIPRIANTTLTPQSLHRPRKVTPQKHNKAFEKPEKNSVPNNSINPGARTAVQRFQIPNRKKHADSGRWTCPCITARFGQ
jgi:hypothetical protein